MSRIACRPSIRSVCTALLFLCSWLCQADTAPIDTRIANADPILGEQIARQCLACHNNLKNAGTKIGPNLWGVVNRKIGTVEDFAYSPAMKSLSSLWSFEALDRFLSDPAGFAPGTAMALPGISNSAERANLIAYLRQLSDRPAPLPEADVDNNSADTADPFGADWPQGEGRLITGYTCNACHSLAIVKQQGQTHEGWDELIDWMIEEQGMSELSGRDREIIVQYLGDHFNIDRQ